MYTHPYIGSQLTHERQRRMLARADQQRLVRQLRGPARASLGAERARWRMTRSPKRSRPVVLPS